MTYSLCLVLATLFTLAFIVPLVGVGVGLFFKQDLGLRHFSDGTTVQQYELLGWLKWLQNPVDGLTGDKRGWYWNEYMAGKPAWFKMFWWSGVRNPWNYLKLRVIGIDMREHVVTKIAGQDLVKDSFTNTGFQILKAEGEKSSRYSLYWVRRWGESDRGIVVQLGWKIKLDHNGMVEENENKYWKGVTAEINPAKDIS